MSSKSNRKAVSLIRRSGLVRPADLEARGVPRAQFYRLVREGLVDRVERGVYSAPRHAVTEHHSYAVVAKRAPNAVICLLSALGFHGLTTQLPGEVWIAIGEKARRPKVDFPPVHVVRFSGPSLTSGIEVHHIEGAEVRVYSAAKTVADCFKYRNKIGIDVALEALTDGWRSRAFTMDELDRFARVCRVSRVMTPYIESLLA
jgi:predicted transcriptional regulator of viral defense system